MPSDGMLGDRMNVALAASMPRLATASPPLGKGAKAARDFEAILLTSLMDSLQKTFAGVPDDSTPGASDYRLMGTQALAGAIAAQGGIGIARLILAHLPAPKVPRRAEPGSVQKG
jgi:Rod binding domain-containing protein